MSLELIIRGKNKAKLAVFDVSMKILSYKEVKMRKNKTLSLARREKQKTSLNGWIKL